MQDFVISVGDRNDVLILNEFKGEFSIISGYAGRDGKSYFNMVYPRDNKTKEPRETAIPMKVRLGNSTKNTIGVLEQMLSVLKNSLNNPAMYDAKTEDLDLPF